MEIYLTKKLKDKYMKDFIQNVLVFDRIEAWKLDDGLASILLEINSNENLNTLYSKKCNFIIPCEPLSYLEFCYSKRIELKIFREIVPSLYYYMERYEGTKFYYDFNAPRNNPNYNNESITGLGCIDDPDYFKINSIRLNLESPDNEIHSIFWNFLTKNLTNLSV